MITGIYGGKPGSDPLGFHWAGNTLWAGAKCEFDSVKGFRNWGLANLPPKQNDITLRTSNESK